MVVIPRPNGPVVYAWSCFESRDRFVTFAGLDAFAQWLAQRSSNSELDGWLQSWMIKGTPDWWPAEDPFYGQLQAPWDFARTEYADGTPVDLGRVFRLAIAWRDEQRARLRERSGPKPMSGHKLHSYRFWRHPRTLRDIRANAWACTEEGEPWARPARRHLPSAWDDQARTVQRSWKKYRRQRWK